MTSVFGWLSRKAPPKADSLLAEPAPPVRGSDAWTLLRGEPEPPKPPSHQGLAPPPAVQPQAPPPPVPPSEPAAPPTAPPRDAAPAPPADATPAEAQATAAAPVVAPAITPTPTRPCRTIVIRQPAGIGNSMFQYMFARMLQARVPDCEVTGYDLPMWRMARRHTAPLPDDAIKADGPHVFDIAKLAAELSATPDRCLEFGGLGMRLEYYGPPGFMRAMFPDTCAPDAPVFGPDHLVINVRTNEILQAVHPDYMPAPIGWYRRLIAETGLTPVFMGQLGRNPYTDALRAAFPDATFIDTQGAATDFETIRNASNIAIAVSTFSWLAAWLSPRAQSIHMPLLGFLNPNQRPDMDLIPRGDPRYRFYRFPLRHWTASADDFAYVTSAEPCGEATTIAGEPRMAAPLALAQRSAAVSAAEHAATPLRPGRRIIVTHTGNSGEWMFQYMFARMLQARVENCEVSGYDLPMWQMSKKNPGPVPTGAVAIRFGHVFDMGKLAADLSSGPDQCLDYGGTGMRLEYYGAPAFMRTMFPDTCAPDAPVTGAESLLIDVKAIEIVNIGHQDFIPAPLGWYRRLLERTGLKPVFLGRFGGDDYSNLLRACFPGATFLESRGEASDFETIRNAAHVAINVWTLSWLAAWLSPINQTIHMPLLGMWNPDQRSDVDLVPARDQRYRFYRFPVRKWAASRDDFSYIVSPAPCGEPVDTVAGSRGLAQVGVTQAAARRPARIIKITQPGNVGNSMFQYMFARMLQARVPDCEVTGYDMPMWKMAKKYDGPIPDDAIKVRYGHVFDVAKMAADLVSKPAGFLDYGGMGQRLQYYGSAGFMRTMFPESCASSAPVFGPDHLLINVRALERHSDYVLAPIGWYRQLVLATGLKPVFMGQIGTDAYSTRLREAFPDAEFLTSKGAAIDFETMRNATNVAISVSTFSWLAAWLSPIAQTIHMPLLGFLNPEQRPDVDLVPRGDGRYRFYRFPVRKWTGSADDLAYAMSEDARGDPVAVAGDLAAEPGPAVADVAAPPRPHDLPSHPAATARPVPRQRWSPLASPGVLRSAPGGNVAYAGPNHIETFHDISAVDELGTLTVPHRLRLYPPMRGPAPLPLFNEAAMPDWIVREHHARPAVAAVNVLAVPGHELGGVGLLQQDGRIFVHPDIYPGYINAAVKVGRNGLHDMWLGSLLTPGAEIIECDVPVATALHPNTVYGHFLLEMLPRLHQLSRLRALGAPFVIAVPSNGAEFIRKFVSFYFEESEILWYDSNRHRVRAPCFILPGIMLSHYALHSEVNSVVEDVKHLVLGPYAPTPVARTYLSRSRFKRGGSHGITNETEVEEAIAGLGFDIVHPQELSLEQQIALYAKTDCFVSSYGSATHNALFAARGAGVFCINWTNPHQSGIAALRSQPLGFMAPTEGGFWVPHVPRTPEEKFFRMDADEVAKQVAAFLVFQAEQRDRSLSSPPA